MNQLPMKTYFLDQFSSPDYPDGKEAIIDLVASGILGDEQYEKIKLRYQDMSRNFDKYADDWEFSPGVEPLPDLRDWDTSAPIPVTHKNFKNLRSELINRTPSMTGAVIGHDLPSWFNLASSERVMIVAQDALRNPKYYHNCDAAICSSPFGQHGRLWRENGRGGKRFAILIDELIKSGYGIYLTDAKKYYLCGWDEVKSKKLHVRPIKEPIILEAYHDILQKEIKIVQPKVIVAMGKKAQKAVDLVMGQDDPRILRLPHFSGSAQWVLSKSKKYNEIKRKDDKPIKEQAKTYAYAIINNIEF